MPKTKKLVMPSFDDIKVSTKTVIASTNASYDIQRLFEELPVVPYTLVKKKRGRKKNIPSSDPNKDIESGSIITLKYFDNIRGVDLKPKKNKRKYFRNALSVVMKVKQKLVNFKLSKNGKFQMTGVKTNEHAILCVKFLWNHILNINNHTLYTLESDILKVILKVVMTNVDFSVGFLINRSNLDIYFNNNTDYNSLLETSFGYTGVNIKFPVKNNPYKNLHEFYLDIKTGKWDDHTISYLEYFNNLSDTEQKKEKNKQRYITFLVFHSGNVIMSGTMKDHMEPFYYKFLEIIKESKSVIEEKLDN
jgi:TATA-box binding protein (TBP) (component of TFIID and TFIIIB)